MFDFSDDYIILRQDNKKGFKIHKLSDLSEVIRKKEPVFNHMTSYIKYLDEITILVLSKSRVGKYYSFKTGEEYSR
jgi:hypothetical protein